MPGKDKLGKKGEEIAAEFLLRNGYRIIHRNWRHRTKEIDIIASIKETLVIVEVKSRTYDFIEDPREAVTIRKQKFLIDAADAFIREHDIGWETRFDIITVVFHPGSFEVEHIEDAFYPTLH